MATLLESHFSATGYDHMTKFSARKCECKWCTSIFITFLKRKLLVLNFLSPFLWAGTRMRCWWVNFNHKDKGEPPGGAEQYDRRNLRPWMSWWNQAAYSTVDQPRPEHGKQISSNHVFEALYFRASLLQQLSLWSNQYTSPSLLFLGESGKRWI